MKIQFLAIFLLFPFLSYTSSKKNDLIREELKGKVIKVTCTSYDAALKSGKVIKAKLIDINTYHYNALGNRTLWTGVYYPDANNTYRYKYNYEYDEKNNEVKACEEGRFGACSISKFDNFGNLIEYKHYMSRNELSSTDVYKYDSANKLIEVSGYAHPHRTSTLKETVLRTKDFFFKYDDKGVLIEQRSNSFSKIMDPIIIRKFYYKNGLLDNVVRSNNGSTTTTSYKYLTDKFGNWTQKISYSGNIPKQIFCREIVYSK